MKKIAALALLLCSMSYGSGKISLQPSYYPEVNKFTPTVGIGIYEHLFWGLRYNGWTGFGLSPTVGQSVFWGTSRHDLEVWEGPVGIAAGFTLRHASQPSKVLEPYNDVHVKFTVQLW